MIEVQNENEHILIQNPQSQTLPAAFDKADKDAFVADCKEVIVISAINIIIIIEIIIAITVTITIILACVELIAMDRMLSKLCYSCAVMCIPVNANNAKFYISRNLLLVKNNKKCKTYNIYRFEKRWILNSLHIRKGRFCGFGNTFMCFDTQCSRASLTVIS